MLPLEHSRLIFIAHFPQVTAFLMLTRTRLWVVTTDDAESLGSKAHGIPTGRTNPWNVPNLCLSPGKGAPMTLSTACFAKPTDHQQVRRNPKTLPPSLCHTHTHPRTLTLLTGREDRESSHLSCEKFWFMGLFAEIEGKITEALSTWQG